MYHITEPKVAPSSSATGSVNLSVNLDNDHVEVTMSIATANSLLEQLTTRLGRSLQAPQEHGILPTTPQFLDTIAEKIKAIGIEVQEIRKTVNASSNPSNSTVVPPSE